MVEKEKKVLNSKKAKMRSDAVKGKKSMEKLSKKEESFRLPSLAFLTSTPRLECTFGEEKAPLVTPVAKVPPVVKPFWLQDALRDEKDEDQGVRLLFNL